MSLVEDVKRCMKEHGEQAAEITRLRTALEQIRDSRQSGRMMFVEPVGDYILRVKEIAHVALQPPT